MSVDMCFRRRRHAPSISRDRINHPFGDVVELVAPSSSPRLTAAALDDLRLSALSSPQQSSRSSSVRSGSESRSEDGQVLWTQTQSTAVPAVDFDVLTNLSLDQWEPRAGSSASSGFRVFSRQLSAMDDGATEVLATGELPCSLAEAAVLLCFTDARDFNATMKSLYGRAFLRGSVLHSFPSAPVSTTTATLPELAFVSGHRCVKVACFARPSLALFARDERWCFLESFEPLPARVGGVSDGFTLTQRSLCVEALPRGVRPPVEVSKRRRTLGLSRSDKELHDLLGISVGYSIEIIAGRQSPAVRIVFYGSTGPGQDKDSLAVAERRLLLLARGVTKLPEIVRRRRVSAQVPLDFWSAAASSPTSPPPSHCVCCTRALHSLLRVKKTPCYLCARFVCSRCWVRQPLETANGRVASVLICSRCLDGVDRGDFRASLASSHRSEPDLTIDVHAPVRRGSEDGCIYSARGSEGVCIATREPRHTVDLCLDEALTNPVNSNNTENADAGLNPDSEARARARTESTMHAIRQLIGVLDDSRNSSMNTRASSSRAKEPEPENNARPTTIDILEARLAAQQSALNACVRAQAKARGETDGTDLQLDAGETDELNLLCELATRELGCLGSMVVVAKDAHHQVVAADLLELQGVQLPREHVFCRHQPSSNQSTLAPHPKQSNDGAQYYSSFPIIQHEASTTVVGSLCCLDVSPRKISPAQLSTLTRLAHTAGKIIHLKSLKCS